MWGVAVLVGLLWAGVLVLAGIIGLIITITSSLSGLIFIVAALGSLYILAIGFTKENEFITLNRFQRLPLMNSGKIQRSWSSMGYSIATFFLIIILLSAVGIGPTAGTDSGGANTTSDNSTQNATEALNQTPTANDDETDDDHTYVYADSESSSDESDRNSYDSDFSSGSGYSSGYSDGGGSYKGTNDGDQSYHEDNDRDNDGKYDED